AAELGLRYESLDFEAAFTIDIRCRQGDRSVRPHFQTVRVRAVIACADRLVPPARSMQTLPWPGTRARCREGRSFLGGVEDREGHTTRHARRTGSRRRSW